MDAQLIFEYGSRERELKREKKSGLPEIQYINLESEEDWDKGLIDIKVRYYHRILKHIFFKYSGSGTLT